MYRDGVTLQVIADAVRPLLVKLPRRPECIYFTKEDFGIDFESRSHICLVLETGCVLPAAWDTDS